MDRAQALSRDLLPFRASRSLVRSGRVASLREKGLCVDDPDASPGGDSAAPRKRVASGQALVSSAVSCARVSSSVGVPEISVASRPAVRR